MGTGETGGPPAQQPQGHASGDHRVYKGQHQGSKGFWGAGQPGTTATAPQDMDFVFPGWVFLQVHPKLRSRDGGIPLSCSNWPWGCFWPQGDPRV